jgi:hypothetical protein
MNTLVKKYGDTFFQSKQNFNLTFVLNPYYILASNAYNNDFALSILCYDANLRRYVLSINRPVTSATVRLVRLAEIFIKKTKQFISN